MRLLAGAALALTLALPAAGAASEIAPGTIGGRIQYRGSAPERRSIEVPPELAYCGDRVADERLVVGPGDGLRDAVVWIRETPPGTQPSPASRARLEAGHCRFEPHVQVVALGQVLEVRNLDPGPLRAHALWSGEDPAFDLALPIQNQIVSERIKRTGILHVQGRATLGFMTAYVVALPHTFAAVTDAGGTFSIPSVPPGRYTLEVWHEALGTHRTLITVEPGLPTRVDLSLAAR